VHEDAEFERLSRALLDNFQARMELKQALVEIETLNQHNSVVITRMRSDADRLQSDFVRQEPTMVGGIVAS
jgi:hypothetical protein